MRRTRKAAKEEFDEDKLRDGRAFAQTAFWALQYARDSTVNTREPVVSEILVTLDAGLSLIDEGLSLDAETPAKKRSAARTR